MLAELSIYDEPIEECVACSGRQIEKWRDKRYSWTHESDGPSFAIFKCLECGTGFLNPPPHQRYLESIYKYSGQGLLGPVTLETVSDSERRFPNSTIDARRLAIVSHQLDCSGTRKALDVGSGFGFFTKELRVCGYETTSLNPGQYENAIFTEMNGDAPLAVTLEQYETEDRFGVILMTQVLEHIVRPSEAIAKVVALLEPGGVFTCAVPNFRSFSVLLFDTRDNGCLWVPEHVNYFTELGLIRLLRRHGLTVTRREFITRVRPNALSERIGLPGASRMLKALVRYGQLPVAWLANELGRGLYINLYAIRRS